MADISTVLLFGYAIPLIAIASVILRWECSEFTDFLIDFSPILFLVAGVSLVIGSRLLDKRWTLGRIVTLATHVALGIFQIWLFRH